MKWRIQPCIIRKKTTLITYAFFTCFQIKYISTQTETSLFQCKYYRKKAFLECLLLSCSLFLLLLSDDTNPFLSSHAMLSCISKYSWVIPQNKMLTGRSQYQTFLHVLQFYIKDNLWTSSKVSNFLVLFGWNSEIARKIFHNQSNSISRW